MLIPYGYIDWAHGHAAEVGIPAAIRLLCCPARRGRVDVDLEDPSLRDELLVAAAFYAGCRACPPRHIGTARRILAAIRSFL